MSGEPHLSGQESGAEPLVAPEATRTPPRRRWRWLAIALVAGVLVGTVAVTAEAWADKGVHRCVTSQRFVAEGGNWRTGAIAAASCQAWRRIHRHQHHLLTRLDRAPGRS